MTSAVVDRATVGVSLTADADLWSIAGPAVVGLFPGGVRAFPGPVAVACARALAGGAVAADRLFSDLAATLADAVAPNRLFAELDRLRAAGLLEGDAAPARDRATALDAAALTACGFRVWSGRDERSAGTDAWIVPGALSRLGEHPLPKGVWLPVEVTAARITAGPLFGAPGMQPCLACLTDRARAHDDLGRLLASDPTTQRLVSHAPLPAARQAALAFLRGAEAALRDAPAGTILLRPASGGQVVLARAVRRGGCPACAAPAERLTLPECPAVLRAGGYRPLEASALLARLESVIDPVTGIVRDLARLPAAPAAQALSQVVVARHAFPLARPDLASTLRNLQGRSAGKGRRAEEGRVGAIAEALERYAGLARQGDEQRVASLSDLGKTAIVPNDWMLYSDDQLGAAGRWRMAGEPSAWVPDPADPDAVLEWTAVTELATGAAAWAPAALCWHQFRATLPGSLPGLADSNGCAAGQTCTDAMVQGLLELIERDAVGIWWRVRARRPEVALHDPADPWIDGVCKAFAALGYDLAVQDLTHDLGVCVVAAIGWPRGDVGPMVLGFGAHLSPATALSRALTEVLQVLPDRPAAEVGGQPWSGLGRVPDRDPPTAQDFDFLRPSGRARGSAPGIGLPAAPPDADAALALLVRRLSDAGLRSFALDQSRPDVPLPVWRLIVPGLRHFRPRFAPGRIDSVPAGLGWAGDRRGPNPCFIRQ